MKRIVTWLCLIVFALGCISVHAEAVPEPTDEVLVEESVDVETEQVRAGKGRLSGVIIGIDPGHQAHGNSGKELVSPKGKEKKAKVSSGTSGVSTRIPEYKTVLEISLALREVLLAEGATVIMTRDTNDIDISNYERAMLMNEAGADLVLRIHCDGASSGKANGIGLFVRNSIAYGKDIVSDPKNLLSRERAAAEALLPAMVAATGAKNRGVSKSDTYTMNNWSTVPIILVECGFMTNSAEDKKLNMPEYQKQLAEGMRNGICAWLGR